ncbi:MAG TPA: hypothetical protein VJT72_05795 [Pseudonocardiaceae bacterium]|nr:hypothetical protein [Pseudonocardiaceae bacterium]
MTRPTTRTLAVIAIVVVATAGIAAIRSAAASTTAPSSPDTGSTGSQIQPSPSTDYWTPERMHNAEPAPMPAPEGRPNTG